MHETIRQALLVRWASVVTRRPRLVLALCLAGALLCVGAAALRLEFIADRDLLVDPTLEWNARYRLYKQAFPAWNDLVVVIEGDADDERVDRMTRRVAERLQDDPAVAATIAGFSTADAGPKLFMTAPAARFDATLDELRAARRLVAAPDVNAALSTIVAQMATDRRAEDDALERLESIVAAFTVGVSGPDGTGVDPATFAAFSPATERWQSLVSDTGSGRLRFIRLRFDDAAATGRLPARLRWLRTELRALIDAERAAADAPEGAIDFGVTGIPVLEADETVQSIRDSSLASALALVLITALMLWNFRGFAVPLIAAGALLIGLAWSFGWVLIAVGHLQVLSIVFSTILMGIGIDYAVLIISRLELLRDYHETLDGALRRVYRRVGPGLLTGAITTAAAFGATALTDFSGMAEMGLIAAGGIVLCVIAVMSALPAALAASGRWRTLIRSRPGGERANFGGAWLRSVDGRPWRWILLWLVALAVLVPLGISVPYDPNVLRLQSPNLESVRWEDRIVSDDARSIWSAIVLTEPDAAAAMTDRLRGLDGVVADVAAMGMLFPADRAERADRVAALRAEAVDAPSPMPGAAALANQLGSLRQALGLVTVGTAVPDDVRSRIESLRGDLAEAAREWRSASPEQWRAFDDAWQSARRELSEFVEGALADRPPGVEDLPPVLRELWTGRDGSWQLIVNPVVASDPDDGLPASVLDPQRLAPFVESVRTVAPEVLGPPVQIHESSLLIIRAYRIAALLAIAAIVVVLLLDFRSPADVVCCLIPAGAAFIGVFGLMELAGVTLNFANLIVMPLIFGLGMDASVNVLHRWRQEPYGKPAGLSGGTGRGITLAMLTTMIAFGSLMISEHRGIRSLGFVMSTGLAVTLLASWTLLPAVLGLRHRYRVARSQRADAAA